MFSMFRAIFRKELRENIGILLLILVGYAFWHASEVNAGWGIGAMTGRWQSWQLHVDSDERSPFLTDSCVQIYLCFMAALAAALGLRQTLGESIVGTWLFFQHRPASRRQLIGLKLLIGLLLYFVCGAGVILIHAFRAATPGVHAAPFFWWMTAPWWLCLLTTPMVYLSVFLVGIRPARWYGTRLFPLILLLALYYGGVATEEMGWGWVWMSIVWFIDLALIRAIFFVAQNRDYV